MDENSNFKHLHPTLKELKSSSGDERRRRNIVKHTIDETQPRPTTVGSIRECHDRMQPPEDTLENKKYNMKINGLIRKGSDEQDLVGTSSRTKDRASAGLSASKRTEALPPASLKIKDDKRTFRRYVQGVKTALREKIFETGDTYLYFNRYKLDSTANHPESGRSSFATSSSPLDSPVDIPTERRGAICVDFRRELDPWDDTPEPGVLCISDSDECDTDLENEVIVKDRCPVGDVNIGRSVYINACEKWGTPPQKYVLDNLPHRSMTLRNRSLGARAIAPICAALKDNLRVESLNLDGVDITDDGIQHLAEMMIDNITISRLNIANNNLGMRGAQVLGHVMVVTNSITHLNLSGNRLDESCAWYLTSGMGSNSSITHLDLSYNELGEETGVLIGAAFARNRKLAHLNMSWNKICGKGAVAIFRALMINNILESLNVSWNGMGYEGMVALCKCLKRNTGLKDLDISNNRLTWQCAHLMAEGLSSNKTLSKLKMGHNPLTTTGVMDILDSIATNDSSVTLLDCSEVPVLGAADLLAATISRRRTFHFLHGGIVLTQDKVGQRVGREVNPMLRIIEYLRLLGLRPLELLKSFDKSMSFELPRKDFIDQIRKIGVKLHPYEIEALANSISGKGYNKNVINYRKLSLAVREIVEAERERKIREREEWLQIKSYHESILKKGTLDDFISQSGSARIGGALTDTVTLDSLKVNSFQTIGISGTSTSRNSTTLSKPHSGPMSMSTKSTVTCSPLMFAKTKPTKKKLRKRRKKSMH